MALSQSLIRLNGGPLEGRTFVSDKPWPMPDRLTIDDLIVPEFQELLEPVWLGTYVKTNESQLEANMPGIVHGAEYTWEWNGTAGRGVDRGGDLGQR